MEQEENKAALREALALLTARLSDLSPESDKGALEELRATDGPTDVVLMAQARLDGMMHLSALLVIMVGAAVGKSRDAILQDLALMIENA